MIRYQQHVDSYEALTMSKLITIAIFIQEKTYKMIFMDNEALDTLLPYHYIVSLKLCRSVRRMYQKKFIEKGKYHDQPSFRATGEIENNAKQIYNDGGPSLPMIKVSMRIRVGRKPPML